MTIDSRSMIAIKAVIESISEAMSKFTKIFREFADAINMENVPTLSGISRKRQERTDLKLALLIVAFYVFYVAFGLFYAHRYS